MVRKSGTSRSLRSHAVHFGFAALGCIGFVLAAARPRDAIHAEEQVAEIGPRNGKSTTAQIHASVETGRFRASRMKGIKAQDRK